MIRVGRIGTVVAVAGMAAVMYYGPKRLAPKVMALFQSTKEKLGQEAKDIMTEAERLRVQEQLAKSHPEPQEQLEPQKQTDSQDNQQQPQIPSEKPPQKPSSSSGTPPPGLE